MSTFETLSKEQRIGASVQRDVQLMCTEVCHLLGLDITKAGMDLILDIFFHKIMVVAEELERFARIAKRMMITRDDCKVLVRKNPDLLAHLETVLPEEASKEVGKRRRTVAGVSATPAKKPRAVPETGAPDSPAIDLTFD